MSFAEEMDELLKLYEKQRAEALAAQKKAEEISITVSAPKRTVTVTVDSGGNVTAIAFPTTAYRAMAPTELAATLMKTIGDAKAKAMSEMSAIMGSMMPGALSSDALRNGTFSLDDLLPANIRDDSFLAAMMSPPVTKKERDGER